MNDENLHIIDVITYHEADASPGEDSDGGGHGEAELHEIPGVVVTSSHGVVQGGVSSPGHSVVGRERTRPLGLVEQQGLVNHLSVVVLGRVVWLVSLVHGGGGEWGGDHGTGALARGGSGGHRGRRGSRGGRGLVLRAAPAHVRAVQVGGDQLGVGGEAEHHPDVQRATNSQVVVGVDDGPGPAGLVS